MVSFGFAAIAQDLPFMWLFHFRHLNHRAFARMGSSYSRGIGSASAHSDPHFSGQGYVALADRPRGRNGVRIFSCGGIKMIMPSPPNPALNSDPACIAFRSFSSFRFLGSARRLGAGGPVSCFR